MSGRGLFPILASLAIPVVLAAGCSSKPEGRKATYPVTGVVIVDGQPAEGVKVELTDVNGLDLENPTMSQTFTGKDGKFAVSTYEQGDGVPEGEYVLTFFWGTISPLNMQLVGPDKLNERYTNPAQSKHKVKVEAGKPADLGRIELTTK